MPKLRKSLHWAWINLKNGHFFLIEHPKVVEKILAVVAILAITVQLTTISAVLFQSSDTRAVIASNDDDSAMGIGNAESTYLINDNGVRIYGPVYYRISSVLRYFGINHYAEGYSDQEHKERSIYFHLMLINLISIYLSSFLLMTLLTHRRDFQLLGTWFLVGSFLQNERRGLLLFMAKPDHAFTLFVTLALVLTWTWIQSAQEEKAESSGFKWMSFGWALAASTKLTTLLFIPGILLVFYQRSKKEWFQQTKYFFKWFSIFYFAIGFPQNFDVLRSLSYLAQQNDHTSLVSWDFLTNQWFHLFYLDLKAPILALTLFAIIFSFQTFGRQFQWKPILQIGTIVLLATLLLISKQTNTPFEWYTFPFTNAALVFYSLALTKCLSYVPLLTARKWKINWRNPYFSVFLFFLVPVLAEPFPDRVPKTYESHQICRNEARQFEIVMNDIARKNKTILAEPYVPYAHEFHDRQVRMTYEMTLEKIERFHPDYIALKKSYYQMYIPQEEGGTGHPAIHIENLESTRNFYRLFFNKSETTDQLGQHWRKTYADNCTYELWENY